MIFWADAISTCVVRHLHAWRADACKCRWLMLCSSDGRNFQASSSRTSWLCWHVPLSTPARRIQDFVNHWTMDILLVPAAWCSLVWRVRVDKQNLDQDVYGTGRLLLVLSPEECSCPQRERWLKSKAP